MLQVYLSYSISRLPENREHDYLAGMPVSIRTAIGRYKRWEDRQATLIGKLLLQYAVRKQMPDLEQPLLERLEYTKNGKPFFSSGPGFNISHSEGVVALALVDAGEVGIDVEKIRPIPMEDFSAYLPDLSGPDGLGESDRLKSFFTCWTRKEAVLKGEGSGLLAPLELVRLQGEKALFNEQVWHLREIDCGAPYYCYAATSERHCNCRIEVVDFFQEVKK